MNKIVLSNAFGDDTQIKKFTESRNKIKDLYPSEKKFFLDLAKNSKTFLDFGSATGNFIDIINNWANFLIVINNKSKISNRTLK